MKKKTTATLLHRLSPYLILTLVCAWYFEVNINPGHDWGGDFAQYIRQAINIAEGNPIGQTSYIPNPDYSILGPALYPNGFPLLLTIPYLIEGNSIPAFLTLIAVFYVLYAFLSLYILQRKFSALPSLLLTLFLLFNPTFTGFKAEVLSDVPFSVFFIAAVALITQKRPSTAKMIAGALLAAYAVFTRSMGWSIMVGVAAFLVFNYTALGAYRKKYFYFLVISIGGYLGLSALFPSSAGSSYTELYNFASMAKDLQSNLNIYSNLLRDFFPIYAREVQFVQVIISGGLVVFFVIGFLKAAFHKCDVLWWIVLVYALSGLAYPANMYGRFFFPLVPFLFLCSYEGARPLLRENPRLMRYGAYLALGTAIYFNVRHTERVRQTSEVPPGPQEAQSQEAFAYLEAHVGEGETVNFRKPRVLALYTELPSFANHPQQEQASLERSFQDHNVNWLLSSTDLPNPALEEYIEQTAPERVFQNSKMSIYKIHDRGAE